MTYRIMTFRMSAFLVAVTFTGFSAFQAVAVPVYTHSFDPRENPAFKRRAVKPPTPETFGDRVQFMALREMPEKGWREELDRYVSRDGLGDIVWAHYSMLFNGNLAEQVAELKRRGLYLFDLWGFVPGVGRPHPKRRWGEFDVPPDVLRLFERELGDRWLGMDNGEQDGRYVASPNYARQAAAFGMDRFECYLAFQNFFENLHRHCGNRMAALVALTYGHHFLKEDVYTMIGAECAQALPNAQVYYSFVRGAGKQYGIPWFGNVSVFNRWGSKSYKADDPSTDESLVGMATGPNKGTSLALLKKLMYAHLFYNCAAVGFESGHYREADPKTGKLRLSPIGEIQQGAVRWLEKNGTPGIMHVPIALMFDFFSGWSFPRSIYGGNDRFLAWGCCPYDLGDYFAHGVLSMLYPGYENSGYFRDERGFNVDTPYGDMADAVMSDAPAWMLKQYSMLVLANTMRPGAELRDTLSAYIAGGGHLVMTEANARTLFPDGLPEGRITVLPGGEWGVAIAPQENKKTMCRNVASEGTTMPCPHPLLPETRKRLDSVFREQMLFGLSSRPMTNGLAFVVCRKVKGEYTICIQNNTWEEQPFEIHSFAGKILTVEELSTPDSQIDRMGYLPEGRTNVTVGTDTASTIVGGGVRLLRVFTEEVGVDELPRITPPSAPRGRALSLRGIKGQFKREILLRPTFFSHYDTVVVGADYLHSRSPEDIAEQVNFTKTRNLKVICDMRPILNSYPDGRLTGNDPRMDAKMERLYDDIFNKMHMLKSRDLVISVTCRTEEMSSDGVNYHNALRRGIGHLADKAATAGISVHLAVSRARGGWKCGDLKDTIALAKSICRSNLKIAPSLSSMLYDFGDAAKVAEALNGVDCDMVLLAAPACDSYGQLYSLSRPVAGWPNIEPAIKALRGRTLIFDASYSSSDDEYRDVALVERIIGE